MLYIKWTLGQEIALGGSVKTHDGKTRRQDSAENKMVMEGGEKANFARRKPPKPARDYQISNLPNFIEMSRASIGLNLINLQIKEFKKGKTKFLFNTGAAVTLVKVRNLGETLIYENKMTLVKITKHEITVIGNNCYHTIR